MSPFVERAIVWVPVALAIATAMDFWAALLHRRVWHGWLWSIHRSHHAPQRVGWERNDALSVLHAPIAIALVLYGCAGPPGVGREIAFGIGVGMSAFGLGYVIVHDGLVHGRLPVGFLRRSRYLRGVERAHRVHHLGDRGGPPYGLFFGLWELTRAARLMRTRTSSSARARRPSGRR